MPEFRKLLDLPATKLNRAEIAQLGQIMCDGIAVEDGHDNRYFVYSGDAVYQFSSIDELMNQSYSRSIDGLEFRVIGWRDNEIIQSVSIELEPSTAMCHISSSDEIWFRGKIEQISDFFCSTSPLVWQDTQIHTDNCWNYKRSANNGDIGGIYCWMVCFWICSYYCVD